MAQEYNNSIIVKHLYYTLILKEMRDKEWKPQCHAC